MGLIVGEVGRGEDGEGKREAKGAVWTPHTLVKKLPNMCGKSGEGITSTRDVTHVACGLVGCISCCLWFWEVGNVRGPLKTKTT